jgi:secreted trypsin-like serine protease
MEKASLTGIFVVALVALCLPYQCESIRGGTLAQLDEWRFMVAWTTADGEYFCSGALITEQHVLTAASCFQNITGFSRLTHRNALARAGCTALSSTQCQVRQISEVMIHPEWNPNNFLNHPAATVNLAVVRLDRPFTLGDIDAPTFPVILVSPQTMGLSQAISGSMTTASWGSSGTSAFEDQLSRRLTVPISPKELCMSTDLIMQLQAGQERDFEPENNICVGIVEGFGSCAGDEGAPLIMRDTSTTGTPAYVLGVFAGVGPNPYGGGACGVA